MRRIVAVSNSYLQIRQARRALEYQTMKHYFPNELAMFEKLGRSDVIDPDMDPQLKQPRLYRINGPSFIRQLFAIIERKHPSVSPLSWTLTPATENVNERRNGRQRNNRSKSKKEKRFGNTNTEGDGDDNDVQDDIREEEEEEEDNNQSDYYEWQNKKIFGLMDGDAGMYSSSPIALLHPLHMPYYASVLGNYGDLLIAEYTGRRKEGALNVLMTVLRSASAHLGEAEA